MGFTIRCGYICSKRCINFFNLYQLKTNKSKKVVYDFDEPKDDHSKVQGLPDNLSVENNKDEQELDLAFTYFEMDKMDLALTILEKLRRETSNTDIRNQAISLIAKIKAQ